MPLRTVKERIKIAHALPQSDLRHQIFEILYCSSILMSMGPFVVLRSPSDIYYELVGMLDTIMRSILSDSADLQKLDKVHLEKNKHSNRT
jgi:hypothetical protein